MLKFPTNKAISIWQPPVKLLRKRMNSSASIFTVLTSLALSLSLSAESTDNQAATNPEPLGKRFELVMPNASEEAWRAVGWRTNLMEAREVAQKQKRPLFLWIMVGNPHGCT
ncbi:MAG: hypothetical protein ACI9UA_006145 [Pseudoalteromonas tetraodonis]|jgi:hypothetical protein